jgi:hypothetical protein
MSAPEVAYRQAIEAIRGERFEEAIALLRPLAEQGHAPAQYQLGVMHANAEGFPLDYVRAAVWIRRAAEQGFARAQSILAWLHASGLGVDQDDREAGRWYLMAAAQGLPKEQYTVAAMYRWGRYGVERDPAEMVSWYRRAADQGFAPAQYALGQLLARGEEVPADPLTAFQWLSLALVNGSEPAKRALMDLSECMSPAELAAAKRQMIETALRQPGVEAPDPDRVGHAY